MTQANAIERNLMLLTVSLEMRLMPCRVTRGSTRFGHKEEAGGRGQARDLLCFPRAGQGRVGQGTGNSLGLTS